MIRFLVSLLARWMHRWGWGAVELNLCAGTGRDTIFRPGHPVGWCSSCQSIVKVDPYTGTAANHEGSAS